MNREELIKRIRLAEKEAEKATDVLNIAIGSKDQQEIKEAVSYYKEVLKKLSFGVGYLACFDIMNSTNKESSSNDMVLFVVAVCTICFWAAVAFVGVAFF